MLVFSNQRGQCHTLAKVNGVFEGPGNPTSVYPGVLETGKKYLVVGHVRNDGNQVGFDIQLDGKPLIKWSGPASSLSIQAQGRVTPSKRTSLSIGSTQSSIVIESFRLDLQ